MAASPARWHSRAAFTTPWHAWPSCLATLGSTAPTSTPCPNLLFAAHVRPDCPHTRARLEQFVRSENKAACTLPSTIFTRATDQSLSSDGWPLAFALCVEKKTASAPKPVKWRDDRFSPNVDRPLLTAALVLSLVLTGCSTLQQSGVEPHQGWPGSQNPSADSPRPLRPGRTGGAGPQCGRAVSDRPSPSRSSKQDRRWRFQPNQPTSCCVFSVALPCPNCPASWSTHTSNASSTSPSTLSASSIEAAGICTTLWKRSKPGAAHRAGLAADRRERF